MGMRGLALLALLGWLATSGCRGPAQWRYEKDLEETPAPAAHAVHQRRLAELMRGLDGMRNERLPTVLDMEAEEARRAREVARVAGALADSAGQIPAAAPAGLDDQERADFEALAEELGQRTQRLADEAEVLTPEQRADQIHEIDATCNRCHLRFRVPRNLNGIP
jgi:cytochrome c556